MKDRVHCPIRSAPKKRAVSLHDIGKRPLELQLREQALLILQPRSDASPPAPPSVRAGGLRVLVAVNSFARLQPTDNWQGNKTRVRKPSQRWIRRWPPLPDRPRKGRMKDLEVR